MDSIPLDLSINIIKYLGSPNEFKYFLIINKKYFKNKDYILYQLYKFVNKYKNEDIEEYNKKINWFIKIENEYLKMLQSDVSKLDVVHSDNTSYWEFRLSHWHCTMVCWFDVSYEFTVFPGTYDVYIVINFNNEESTQHTFNFETVKRVNNQIIVENQEIVDINSEGHNFVSNNIINCKIGRVKVVDNTPFSVHFYKHGNWWIYNIDVYKFYLKSG